MIDAKGKRVARKDTSPPVPLHILESRLTPAQRRLYERSNDEFAKGSSAKGASAKGPSAKTSRPRSKAASRKRSVARAKTPSTATEAKETKETKE